MTKEFNRHHEIPSSKGGLTNKYNIHVVVHIMVGLPNETFNDIKNTVILISLLKQWVE